MVNTIGGKGYKKGKKGGSRNKNPSTKFDTNDGYHHYGQVVQILGGNRIGVRLTNDEMVQAVIPGKFMNKVWFRKDDYVVLKRENNFFDVVQKITSSEIQSIASNSLCVKLDKDDYNIYQTELNQNNSDDEDFNETLNKEAKKVMAAKIKDTGLKSSVDEQFDAVSGSETNESDESENEVKNEVKVELKPTTKVSTVSKKVSKHVVRTYVETEDDIKNLMNL